MTKVVIADASPLIAFGSIDRLSILFKLFKKVIIPKTVADECLFEKTRPGAVAIARAIEADKIQVYDSIEFEDRETLQVILDEGEADAIALARSLHLPLIIDEKLGRNIAREMGIKIIGTVGILLLAKQKSLVKEIKPILLQLKNGHYFLSDALIKDVLKKAKEK